MSHLQKLIEKNSVEMLKKAEAPRQRTPMQAGANVASNGKVAGSRGTVSMKSIEPTKLSLDMRTSQQHQK